MEDPTADSTPPEISTTPKKITLQHWNEDQLCVVDVETTGLIPGFNEVIQLCILPLDANLEPREDVQPFYLNIIPEMPSRWNKQAAGTTGLSLTMLELTGVRREAAIELFYQWFDMLKLPLTRGGFRKKILPLGHNYPFDRAFLHAFFGQLLYEEYFSGLYRDTMAVANYLNDRAAMHGETVPFAKQSLSWVAQILKIEHGHAHDALADSIITAQIYKKMTLEGLLG